MKEKNTYLLLETKAIDVEGSHVCGDCGQLYRDVEIVGFMVCEDFNMDSVLAKHSPTEDEENVLLVIDTDYCGDIFEYLEEGSFEFEEYVMWNEATADLQDYVEQVYKKEI